MPWVGFEPTIPAFERAKTVHVLYCAAMGSDVISFTAYKWSKRCVIQGSGEFDYAEYYLLGCGPVQSGKSLLTFQREVLSPSSGLTGHVSIYSYIFTKFISCCIWSKVSKSHSKTRSMLWTDIRLAQGKSHIPAQVNSYVARNWAIHSTEQVAMWPHHCIH
jgi:hypothetical protein